MNCLHCFRFLHILFYYLCPEKIDIFLFQECPIKIDTQINILNFKGI